jgi:hypothetical protein
MAGKAAFSAEIGCGHQEKTPGHKAGGATTVNSHGQAPVLRSTLPSHERPAIDRAAALSPVSTAAKSLASPVSFSCGAGERLGLGNVDWRSATSSQCPAVASY